MDKHFSFQRETILIDVQHPLLQLHDAFADSQLLHIDIHFCLTVPGNVRRRVQGKQKKDVN